MSQLARETREIPQAVARLLDSPSDIITAADALRAADPALLMTVARGSSDHAATFLAYAAGIMAGLPVASVGPSLASVYGAQLRAERAACLAVSQSGASPDIVATTTMLRDRGALTLALTNHPDSPLAQAAHHVLPLHAGPERAVAATKTVVNSIVAGLMLLAHLRRDAILTAALHALPRLLETALSADWSPLQDALQDTDRLYCLGRGPCYALSNEAALKLKETCQLQAESFSGAEVQHGQMSVVGPGFPVLVLAVQDAARAGQRALATRLAGMGARVFLTDTAEGATPLPALRTAHPLTDPLPLIVSVYALAERLARARGIDPDAPRHLQKVTRTR